MVRINPNKRERSIENILWQKGRDWSRGVWGLVWSPFVTFYRRGGGDILGYFRRSDCFISFHLKTIYKVACIHLKLFQFIIILDIELLTLFLMKLIFKLFYTQEKFKSLIFVDFMPSLKVNSILLIQYC